MNQTDQLSEADSNDVSQPTYTAPKSLSETDFRFVFHSRPHRFFKTMNRPLQVISAPPDVEPFGNVIYKPATQGWYPFDGCLYDESGTRIEASCLRRYTADFDQNMEPIHYDGDTREMPAYDSPLLFLGFFHPSYGHFLLEVLSYWWLLGQEHDDFDRFLILIHDPSLLDKPHVKACLEALNIKRENLVFFDRPTRLSHVVVPSPSVQLHSHIHKQYKHLMEKMAFNMGAGDVKQTEQPLYISRRLLDFGKDQYIGQDKIEAYLESRGVRVIHPQDIPFSEQFQIYNQHDRILGMIGSGMHNIVFSPRPKTITYLTTDAINENFFFVDNCFEADSTFVNAAVPGDKYQVFFENVKKGITGVRKRREGFLNHHHLDHERVIDWLAHYGDI